MQNSITSYFSTAAKKKDESSKKVKLQKPAASWYPKSDSTRIGVPASRGVSNTRATLKRPSSTFGDSKPKMSIMPSARKPSASFQVRVEVNKQGPDNEGLSPQQKVVFDSIMNGKSVFFTGAAGTGKSFLLHKIIAALRQRYAGLYDVAVTATTGLASSTIGGETIHSWANWRLGNEEAHIIANKILEAKYAPAEKPYLKVPYRKWNECKVLILDEISMLDGKLLEKMDTIAKKVRNNNNPFGGIQVVFTGDFFQLPPVDKDNRSIMCFESSVWGPAVGNNQLVLNKIFRQKTSDKLVGMLNEMRLGKLSPQTIENFQSLQRQVQYEDGFEPTQLFPLRAQVDAANNERMNALCGKLYSFKARDEEQVLLQSNKRRFEELMAPAQFNLRVGAQVLHIVNKKERQLVNGSRGRVLTFVTMEGWSTLEGIMMASNDSRMVLKYYNAVLEAGAINQDLAEQMDTLLDRRQQNALLECALMGSQNSFNERLPLVDFGGSKIHLIEREVFKINGAPPKREVVASREQLPLILSYALSIHKAQGQTIDRLVVDLSKVFTEGQAYVAVSRATAFDRLQVKGFHERKVLVNPKVVKFYEELVSKAI